MRLLGAAQEGGSTVSECFLTVSQIQPENDENWHREWKRIAETNDQRGNAAFNHGHVLTAQSNWLRAINYYQTAAFLLDTADKRRQAMLASMRSCARRYLEHRTPPGEVVQIPWLDGYPLEGYFLPPPTASNRTPAVVCIGEPGHQKEEYLYKTTRYARDRGMSLLAVDLLGSGTDAQFEKVAGRPDLEAAIGRVMDYLIARVDVDERRIAILGADSGSSFVARGVALDRRFAAAVCDGGIWDLQERTFLMNRIESLEPRSAARTELGSIARNIKCPVLITLGEHGWLPADRVTDLFHQLQADHEDISLKIFLGSETAASQGHTDNATLANEFIFDWIADRLALDPS